MRAEFYSCLVLSQFFVCHLPCKKVYPPARVAHILPAKTMRTLGSGDETGDRGGETEQIQQSRHCALSHDVNVHGETQRNCGVLAMRRMALSSITRLFVVPFIIGKGIFFAQAFVSKHLSSTCRSSRIALPTTIVLSTGNNYPQPRRSSRYQSKSSSNSNPAIAIAIENNKKIVALGKTGQWENLLEFATKEFSTFNNVNCATLMSQLGRIRSFDKSDPRFLVFLRELAEMINERGLPWIQVRQAATIIHAIGKMRLKNPSTNKILEWISEADTAAKFVEQEDPQAVANVAWACATLGYEAPKLFAEIESRSTWLVENGTPQAVANTAWAFATLGCEAPKLFAEIERQSEWLVKEGKPQAVANTAWACATLGYEAPNLFAEIDRRSKWLVENGIPQAVANAAWACAALGYKAPKLFAEIERQSKWLVKAGKPQDFSNTAWACATLCYEAPIFFAEIECRSKWLVENGTPQDVANTAWAFATLGFQAPNLFANIERQSEWLVEKGTPQAIANTAWACASLGYEAPFLFDELDRHLDERLEKWNAQNIANTCYAIAVLGLSKESEVSLAKLWERAIHLFVIGQEFADKDFWQLAQTRMFAKANGVSLSELPEMMMKRTELGLARLDDNSVSKASEEISKLLKEIGFYHELEVSPDSTMTGGMMAIDFACKERKIAVEYDGPWHYLKAVGNGVRTSTENGATKAKRRFLQQLGWSVINIDYREHDRLRRTPKEKEWLRKMLKDWVSGEETTNGTRTRPARTVQDEDRAAFVAKHEDTLKALLKTDKITIPILKIALKARNIGPLTGRKHELVERLVTFERLGVEDS